MKTITELQETVCAGDQAQRELDKIAENIYNHYVLRIKEVQKALSEEHPMKEDLSPLTNCNMGFHSYRFIGRLIGLQGHDYFRGERNYETDWLPISVFTDDEVQRNKIIDEFVAEKVNATRTAYKNRYKREEQEQRDFYESLKEKYETK